MGAVRPWLGRPAHLDIVLANVAGKPVVGNPKPAASQAQDSPWDPATDKAEADPELVALLARSEAARKITQLFALERLALSEIAVAHPILAALQQVSPCAVLCGLSQFQLRSRAEISELKFQSACMVGLSEICMRACGACCGQQTALPGSRLAVSQACKPWEASSGAQAPANPGSGPELVQSSTPSMGSVPCPEDGRGRGEWELLDCQHI